MRHVVHLGLYVDETAELSEWHLPQAHALEAWSDARAFDGTVTIGHPLIAPLYDGRSAYEVMALLMGDEVQNGRDLIRRNGERGLRTILRGSRRCSQG